MKKITIVFLVMLSLNFGLIAQIGGSQAYAGHSQGTVSTRSIISNDVILTIQTSILVNKKADKYLITIGVDQDEKTVSTCNKKINNRINRVVSGLKKLGIKKKDVYIDFISQVKIYNHKVEGNKIIEYLEGFNLKKNLIIKTKNIDLIDQLLEICASEEIYDLIKVEYLNDHPEEIYDMMFAEAMKIADKKKDRFLKYSTAKLNGKYRIVNDEFSIYYPKDRYATYNEVFATSEVNTSYRSDYVTESVRKGKSVYYNGLETHIYVDKVIGDISPEIGIQYYLKVEKAFELYR